MEDIWIYRSLVFAIIEYALLIFVLLKGKQLKPQVILLLFFLANYQIGEFIFLLTGSYFGLQFATISTTMLPPIGIWIFERLTKKNMYSWLFGILAVLFGIGFLLQPDLLAGAQECFCTVKYAVLLDSGRTFVNAWGVYYIGTLILSMIIAAIGIIINQEKRKELILMLLAYASFFPVSFVIVWTTDAPYGSVPSVMCALALIAGCIASFVSWWRE